MKEIFISLFLAILSFLGFKNQEPQNINPTTTVTITEKATINSIEPTDTLTTDNNSEFQKEIEKCPIKTYDKNVLNKTVTYYGQVKRNSSSGDTGFFFYDPKLEKRGDSICDWFWAMPKNIFEDDNETEITYRWIDFIKNNRSSVFKITGTIRDFDCNYYDSNHCLENIEIKTIEILSQDLTNIETDSWNSKTTDWLNRTYNVNNLGNEYEDSNSKVSCSFGWTKSISPFVIDEGNLVKNEMNDNLNWDSYPETKNILLKSNLSENQKQYFYDNNYVPRSIERFDVTGDGITETIVTSLPLGCGRCVGFYMTIFTKNGIYNAGTNQGTIIKTKNGNGFYLTNNDLQYINITKYEWDKNRFIEVAQKEIIL